MTISTSEYTTADRPRFDVLGVAADAVSLDTAMRRVESWIESKSPSHYVTFTNVHAVMEANVNPEFKTILNSADMVCPDGMPLVWLGRNGGANVSHVRGPEFFRQFLSSTAAKSYRHYFYGGEAAVTAQLARQLKIEFPEINIAGWYSPPFRPLNLQEKEEFVHMVEEAKPDVLWVALGCPKQEQWMSEFSTRLSVPVMLGVGQAFAIEAGVLKQAPWWLREHGLEWLFRLCSEPKRLWRRYLKTNLSFLFALSCSRFLPPQLRHHS